MIHFPGHAIAPRLAEFVERWSLGTGCALCSCLVALLLTRELVRPRRRDRVERHLLLLDLLTLPLLVLLLAVIAVRFAALRHSSVTAP